MGHLRNKYDSDYFLGGVVDSETGQEYAVLGHAEFREGRTHERLLSEFEFTRALVGSFSGRDILEIGFGRGDFIRLFLEAGVKSYTGIDFSPSAVEIAKKHFDDPRLKLLNIEATDLDEAYTFDIIGMYDVLEHIPVFEMEVVWKKVRSLLKPGGFVVITTPIFQNPNSTDHTDLIPAASGMHCHKQTWGTLARTAFKHNFMIARTGERMIGLFRSDDLKVFTEQERNIYNAAQTDLLRRYGINNFDGLLTQEIERRLVPGAGRVAIGCVADNNPKYLSQALRLLLSLRWFGGSMAGANFFVCVVDKICPAFALEFERLGAFVRTVSRFSPLHPHSNKLRLLEVPEVGYYDTFLLLDCDTLIVQDPWQYLNGRVFEAKIADLPTVPNEIFQRLFQHFGIPAPKQDYMTNPNDSPTVWYCNAGVLVFPKEMLFTLGRSWLKYNKALLERLDLLGENKTFCDQASLSLAFASEPVQFKELPVAMNFPIHLTNFEKTEKMQECDPVIIHYHDKVDENGFLLSSPFLGVQKRIKQFNARLKDELSKSAKDQPEPELPRVGEEGLFKKLKKIANLFKRRNLI